MNKAKRKQARTEDLVRRLSAATGSSGSSYRLTLSGSEIGGTQGQRATLRCLGLRKRGSQSVVKDSPESRGRIITVAHLLTVEDA